MKAGVDKGAGVKQLMIGIFKILRVAMGVWLALVVGIVVLMMFSSQMSAGKVFKLYFKGPPPAGIRILEGGGSAAVDYSVRLVFTGDEKAIEGLLQKYPLTPHCSRGVEFSGYAREASAIGDQPCHYNGFDYANNDHEELFLYWDRASNKVFLWGRST